MILLALVLGALVWAWLIDRDDRRHHRRQRSAGEMSGARRKRILDFRSSPNPGDPVDEGWVRPDADRDGADGHDLAP